uniref:Gamma-interferon-inducible lysosomal thiol reductase n=1 Tax=Ciona intestinalis TaxID=7719 RepID=F6WA11_CIOIN|nr:gamma-interferon-inducible lysosomal thiol reductase [Ciona intestinalis]|eukprot:XP_002120789.1 gamma-interferon-inducible lysosomal thiol reductase [Ciona intestinalis]
MEIKYLILFFFCGSALCCDIAPAYWCDTEAIASQCGVLPACSDRLYPSYATEADPVVVGVYFECLCPDSIRFITNMLFPTWVKLRTTGVMKIMMVPYGKATMNRHGSGYNFTCQHGPQECEGNIIENCLLNETNYDEAKYLPVIQCMERSPQPVAAAEQCITRSGLNWTNINACASSVNGTMLMHKAGLATAALNPSLTWVPWITINGIHTDHIQSSAITDLLTLVCETYKGEKPRSCQHTKHGIGAYARRQRFSNKLYFRSRG